MTNKVTRNVRIIEAEVYSRVVGYYRPVQNWNRGKQLEFQERKLHRMPEEMTNSWKSLLKMVG